MENFSVFDIVGPRMTGPSSSHTAGAAKIALIARRIINRPVKEVRFTLYGSFAETGRGHGTDKALIGGILGFEPDDPRIREAYKYAKSRGVLVNIIMSDERWTEVKGESIGGGNILITEIDHLEVELSGDYPTLIIRHHDEPGVIAEVSHVLAQMRLNIAFMKVFRHGKGEDAYMCIETDTEVNEGMQAILLQLCKCIRQLIVV